MLRLICLFLIAISPIANAGQFYSYRQWVALDETLRSKVALARRQGLEVSLVTQFGFEAAPILRWIAALRATGIALRASRLVVDHSARTFGFGACSGTRETHPPSGAGEPVAGSAD